jgi:hypothetical protein
VRASKQLRAITLTVAEVEDMLESLRAARMLRNLSGRQRQQLEDAYGSLDLARRAANGGAIPVSVEVLTEILRAAAMTQLWLGQALLELFADDENE